MTTLQFADTHNLVVFLAKPTESKGFEQIVDFLNAHTIKYALMVNPTIYTSCIEQLWATVKVKTVNGEVQLQALVDGKKIIVTEASVRHDLQLNNDVNRDPTIGIKRRRTPENKEHFLSEKETGIGDKIYSTVDACKTANEMWIAIERLQQESMESYYSRFYKLMNELTRNNLQGTTMQVNVQFLQQLQPEWSRFVTVVKLSKEIDTISYHTLFDILKQCQNEVNDIRAEKIAKSANLFALLLAAQPYSDNYYQSPKPQRFNATSSSTGPSASTKHKGKEIAKPVTPHQENKTEDTTPRYNNNNQSGQFGNQRTMTVAGTRGTVQNNDENNVFANERQHSENNTAECADERAALANLIANLTLDTEENKTILKQLKKANASLTQELEECKTNLDETSRALGEATSCRDSCLIALQNKQNELEKYIAFNDRTIDYDILQTKLNETLGLLARKDIDIKEGLKTKAYEISVVNQKHDELVKRSLLTKSQFEGQLKEKSKVISDLKVKEEGRKRY
ncbi:hypothetical protein Tco_1379325 [Tanacetum coccineum]